MSTRTVEELHSIACQEHQDTYTDPVSGYQVITKEAHLRRGSCCGNSCRHCPYDHINVKLTALEKSSPKKPELLNWAHSAATVDVLFWSGGKDSLLALFKLKEEKRAVVLLTSYGAHTNRVSIQNIDVKHIARQAEFLCLPLCLVPLYPNTDYQQCVQEALELIVAQTGCAINRLVFGDLHLEEIRQWRVDTWPAYEIYTPLFNVSYTELLDQLWNLQSRLNLAITLSTDVQAGATMFLAGTPYDPEFVKKLREHGLDMMLEHGEGHTLVLPILS